RRADLLGLLLRGALDIDPVDRGHREVDRELDRVICPSETLSALHLLGELAEPSLQVVRIAEQAAEATSFHAAYRSRRGHADPGRCPAVHCLAMAASPHPRLRRRIELAIRLAAPALDLFLALGAGTSRLLSGGQSQPVGRQLTRTGRPARRGLS